MLFAKGLAATEGRDFLIPDDVKVRRASDSCATGLVLKPEADLEGVTPDQVVRDVVKGSGSAEMTESAQLAPAPIGARGKAKGRFGVAFGRRFFLLLLIGLVWIGPAWANPKYLCGNGSLGCSCASACGRWI